MKQASTAIRVFHQDIEPTLPARHQFVWTWLETFIEARHYNPTAGELLRFIEGRLGHGIDVSKVRPRLTEMEKIGWVRHGATRPCDVSGKPVMTWIPSAPTPPEQQPLSFDTSVNQ